MKAIKVTSKGQITIPIELRSALGIDDDTYLEVSASEHEIRLRKLVPARPLSDDDPIWGLIGVGRSAGTETSAHHDRDFADGEIARWRRKSS
jgi:AbrB family looped-hinge helix DNA binding protein